jgi:hypothetical protein
MELERLSTTKLLIHEPTNNPNMNPTVEPACRARPIRKPRASDATARSTIATSMIFILNLSYVPKLQVGCA